MTGLVTFQRCDGIPERHKGGGLIRAQCSGAGMLKFCGRLWLWQQECGVSMYVGISQEAERAQ